MCLKKQAYISYKAIQYGFNDVEDPGYDHVHDEEWSATPWWR